MPLWLQIELALLPMFLLAVGYIIRLEITLADIKGQIGSNRAANKRIMTAVFPEKARMIEVENKE